MNLPRDEVSVDGPGRSGMLLTAASSMLSVPITAETVPRTPRDPLHLDVSEGGGITPLIIRKFTV